MLTPTVSNVLHLHPHTPSVFTSIPSFSSFCPQPRRAQHHHRVPARGTGPAAVVTAVGRELEVTCGLHRVSHHTHSSVSEQRPGGEAQNESFLRLAGNARKCRILSEPRRKPQLEGVLGALAHPRGSALPWPCHGVPTRLGARTAPQEGCAAPTADETLGMGNSQGKIPLEDRL